MSRRRAVLMREALYGAALLVLAGCVAPTMAPTPAAVAVPSSFARAHGTDSASIGDIAWRTFFEDTTLVALIDTAIHNNP